MTCSDVSRNGEDENVMFGWVGRQSRMSYRQTHMSSHRSKSATNFNLPDESGCNCAVFDCSPAKLWRFRAEILREHPFVCEEEIHNSI